MTLFPIAGRNMVTHEELPVNGEEMHMRWFSVRSPITNAKGRGITFRGRRAGIRILNRLGLETKALNLIESTLRSHPDRTELHIEAGRLYLRRGQFDKSAWHFSQVNPALDPANFVPWLEDLLEEDYEEIITDRASALYALGTWYMKTGDPARALEYLKGIRSHRTHPGVYNRKGLCYLALGRYQDALGMFRIAARTGGPDPEIMYNKGVAHVKLQAYEKALEMFERAQRRGFSSVDLLNNKGYCLFYLGRHQEAVLSYETARKMAPRDVIVLSNLAVGYERLRRFSDAFDCYKAAIRLDPADAVLRDGYGLALQAAGRYAEALEQHARAVELEPSPVHLGNHALCLQRMGRGEQALEAYDAILAAHPDDRRVWGMRADLLMELGRGEDAADSLNRSLGLTG